MPDINGKNWWNFSVEKKIHCNVENMCNMLKNKDLETWRKKRVHAHLMCEQKERQLKENWI